MARDTKNRIETVPTPRASTRDPDGVGESSTARVPASVAASGSTAAETALHERVTPGETTTDQKPRRGPAAFRPTTTTAPPEVGVPTQPSAPSPLVSGAPAPGKAPVRRVRTAVWVGSAAVLVLALATGSAVYAADQRDLAAQDAALAASLRVDEVVLAGQRDAAVAQSADVALTNATYVAGRARTAAHAQAVVDQAAATLAATPNAGASRDALAAAATTVSSTLTAPGTSASSLRRVEAGVAAPQKAAVDAQAAWQAAENARIAAEQAAAAQAQAEAAAAAARTPKKSSARAPRVTSSRTTAGTAQAPAPSSSGVPAGGKVCSGSGGSGASASSAGAIGSAINSYRAGLGLPQLSVSTSGTLTSHAINMANTGGIWHSGSDNIVGCVSSGSASSLVGAWSRSAGHDAQMRRTDVSSMSVGGATLGGWLFGAVKFH